MKKGISLLLLAVGVLFTVTTYATDLREIRGQLVSLDSQKNSITLKAEVLGLSGPEKRDINLSLTSDTTWTICLNGQCTEKSGIEGFRLVNEYATFEAYGLSAKGCNVILTQSGNEITSARVNIC